MSWGLVARNIVRAQSYGRYSVPPGYNAYASFDGRLAMWKHYYDGVERDADRRCDNLARCLREASMLAVLESRTMAAIAGYRA